MFETVTFEDIMARMLRAVPDTFDKRAGSVIYDALAPAAAELVQLYMACDYVLAESFADTAGRDHLILRAAERGLYPYPATKAQVKLEYTPTSLDLTGRRFSLNNLNYIVIETTTSGECVLECETPGSEGNALGSVIPIEYIDGLQTAAITSILIHGEDDEDTESFRERYFDSFEKDAFGGNITDYQNRTNALPGVGATKVLPAWDGGGTVKLIIENSDFASPSSNVVSAVQTAIDPAANSGLGYGLAPIGHEVTVVGVDSVTVNIAVQLTFKSGYGWITVGPLITEALGEYLLDLRKNWADSDNITVRISQVISKVISVPGVDDVTGAKINNNTANLELDEDEIPILGEVTQWTGS